MDFTKLDLCIDIVEIWFGIAIGYISSIFDRVICRPRWFSWMRRPTGDQEVAGSTPAEVGNILSWRLIVKYFLRSSPPSADSRRAVVSFWRKNVHNTGQPLRGLSLSSKHVVR